MDAHISKSNLVARRFSKAATSYDSVAFVQKAIGERLLSRLSYLKIDPTQILDIGSGTGQITQQLQTKFSNSTVVGLDCAFTMCEQTKTKQVPVLCADMHALPFRSNSFDLIFSNCTLQWSYDLKACLSAWLRVLKPNGTLLFSTFGPDTLKELRAAFSAVSDTPHVHSFLDMHDLGDCCLKLGFIDPVMDREDLTVLYSQPTALMRDLKRLGATNQMENRAKGLMGKQKWQRMLTSYQETWQREDGQIPATYEIIYCYAMKGSDPTPHDIPIKLR